eukprot:CAMPEP_0202360304 /NCGR_PEP_ID=MMETSP1126-20121109/13294_1 /ASSEMBLY_ACC=CAM_ASM_000457 /TAXON_ID=3047 /ORGANISM="Dunaliella tertiolecta, Strain CCMP1320" /LENGTH=70 /DNA_ID=CAMNT_0048953977 /DNA_START=122 /DNA_END=334 /DNA_ORIENTATION=+
MRMMPRLKVTEQISVRSEEKRRMYLRATPPSSIRQFMDFLSIVASTTLDGDQGKQTTFLLYWVLEISAHS